jgi:hypothetical protein
MVQGTDKASKRTLKAEPSKTGGRRAPTATPRRLQRRHPSLRTARGRFGAPASPMARRKRLRACRPTIEDENADSDHCRPSCPGRPTGALADWGKDSHVALVELVDHVELLASATEEIANNPQNR